MSVSDDTIIKMIRLVIDGSVSISCGLESAITIVAE
jgi:hypothetical protein